jgi:hypothetical protein
MGDKTKRQNMFGVFGLGSRVQIDEFRISVLKLTIEDQILRTDYHDRKPNQLQKLKLLCFKFIIH